MMLAELAAACGTVCVASLLGSVHCAGMCGGLSACATPAGFARTPVPVQMTSSVAGPRPVGPSLLRMQLSYHGARLIGYAALGAVAGAVGAALDLGGSLVGMQRVASVLAGATIALLGALTLLRIAGARIPHVAMPAPIVLAFQAAHRRAASWPPVTRSLAIGAVTPLLPCGWLYAFVAVAAGAGSALGGAAVMAAFWAGTVPALIGVALGVRILLGAGPLRRVAPVLASLLMIAVGVHVAFVRGPKAAIVASSVRPVSSGGAARTEGAPDSLESAVEKAGDDVPACCREEGRS